MPEDTSCLSSLFFLCDFVAIIKFNFFSGFSVLSGLYSMFFVILWLYFSGFISYCNSENMIMLTPNFNAVSLTSPESS